MDSDTNKPVTLDDLALMVGKGFLANEDRFDKLDSRMDKIDSRMDKLETQMATLTSSVNNYLKLTDKRYLELKARQDLIVSWVKKIADKAKVTIDFKELEKIV